VIGGLHHRRIAFVPVTFDDFLAADEVFMTGNITKVTPVTKFEDREYEIGPVARRARDLYWDWAKGEG